MNCEFMAMRTQVQIKITLHVFSAKFCCFIEEVDIRAQAIRSEAFYYFLFHLLCKSWSEVYLIRHEVKE